MFTNIAISVFKISLGTSIVILMFFLLTPIINRRYNAKWKCWIWLIISIRLLLPIDTNFLESHIGINISKIDTKVDKYINLPITNHGADSVIESTIVTENKEELPNDKGITYTEIMYFIWIAGVSITLIYHTIGYITFRKQVLRWSIPVKNKLITEEFEKAVYQMRIKGNIKVLVSDKISSPMMIGFLKPILLFPCEGYKRSDLRFIIKHELIHYKRHHIWFKLLLLIANSVHWFNPLVYLVRREANKNIEFCCDNEVVKGYSFNDRRAYSNTIINGVSLHDMKKTVLSTYFSQSSKMLKERLKEVLNMKMKRRGIVTFVIITICILIGGESIAFNNQKQEKKQIILENYSYNIDDVTNAVLSNDISFVEKVIKEGNIDLSTKDSKGEYPLEVTMYMTNCDMAKLLLKAGADPYKFTNNGKSIYDIVMDNDSEYYKNIFKEYKK
ncbi:hypothetical protein SH2C18_28470 [Clostridium sediminicola]|uniref:M56 family metallopeptidase n=1 Tax=Clostridium sediminicola TaxID=3114879 RepID=UPI0031F22D28